MSPIYKKGILLMNSHVQPSELQKTSVAPFLSVRRGASAIDFYQRAFGAREVFRIEDKKGEVVARLSVDGSEFWLADESPKHARAFSI